MQKVLDNKTGLRTNASVNEVLAEELHKPEIKKFKRRKFLLGLRITFGQQIQLKWDHYFLSHYFSFNYFLCVIDVFTKYAWVKDLKDKKIETFLHGFVGIVNGSK